MRKYAILVLMMAVVVAVTSSCGLIVKDPEVDAQTVIIEVAGEQIVKADVKQAIENVLDYQEYLYSLYGYTFDRKDANSIASAQDSAINALIEEVITDQKIVENSFDQFTEEELAAITADADETYAGYVDTVQSTFFADTELTGDELNAAVEAKLLEVGYRSRESLIEQGKNTEALNRLREMIIKDVAVSEDEITSQYDEGLSEQMTAYASDITKYASDVNNGSIIYFQPHGYRYVKNLLIMIGSDERSEINKVTTQLTDDQNALASMEESIAALPEDPATDTEEQKTTREELTAQVDTLNAEIDTLTAQLNELTAQAYGAIQPTVNMVEEKIAAGEDFDALLEEYGEDTGMTVEPQKSQGYLVCEGLTTYVSEFVTEAMALENVGDVSAPFRSVYGVHILEYASDLDGGKVPVSSVHDAIAEQLLQTKQDTTYNETVSQWVTEANAKIHADRLAD